MLLVVISEPRNFKGFSITEAIFTGLPRLSWIWNWMFTVSPFWIERDLHFWGFITINVTFQSWAGVLVFRFCACTVRIFLSSEFQICKILLNTFTSFLTKKGSWELPQSNRQPWCTNQTSKCNNLHHCYKSNRKERSDEQACHPISLKPWIHGTVTNFANFAESADSFWLTVLAMWASKWVFLPWQDKCVSKWEDSWRQRNWNF